MAPDRIRDLLHAMPFRPFTVELPSGNRVSVRHPDFTVLSPSGRTLIVYPNPRSDDYLVLDVFLISAATVAGEKTAKRGG